MSVDAEQAFSACTLMLGKLRTHLSDESFCAGLLLRSWHLAGLLPEVGEMAQCLRDGDMALMAKKRHMKWCAAGSVGSTLKTKKARIGMGSSDSNM